MKSLQDVESYPEINQKDNSHPKRKYTDCKQVEAVLYLQVVDLVDGDPILKEHSV